MKENPKSNGRKILEDIAKNLSENVIECAQISNYYAAYFWILRNDFWMEQLISGGIYKYDSLKKFLENIKEKNKKLSKDSFKDYKGIYFQDDIVAHFDKIIRKLNKTKLKNNKMPVLLEDASMGWRDCPCSVFHLYSADKEDVLKFFKEKEKKFYKDLYPCVTYSIKTPFFDITFPKVDGVYLDPLKTNVVGDYNIKFKNYDLTFWKTDLEGTLHKLENSLKITLQCIGLLGNYVNEIKAVGNYLTTLLEKTLPKTFVV